MMPKSTLRWAAMACCGVLVTSGCSFDGINALPLPGTVGTASDATTYRVKVANVGTLESNSPVMVGDVVVGTVRRMTVEDWTANVEISVKPDVVVPENAVATVGQTSLLGSMHLALDPPLGENPTGRLTPDATIPLSQSSTYPSTEQTLSSLSVVVNGGGLTQIGDIVHNFNAALDGRQGEIRDLLGRMNKVVGLLDAQQDNIIASVSALNRLAGAFAGQSKVLARALDRIPPALDVLNQQRPRITTALTKLGGFSDTATQLINESHEDIVRNLQNLQPTIRALADIGPDLTTALSFLPTFPYTQEFIDRGIRGDYMNQFIVFDFTIPRLKSGILLGTRWGEPNATMVPAPGDPWYNTYTRDPLSAPITPIPDEIAPIPPLTDGPSGVPGPASGPPVAEAPVPTEGGN